MPMVTAIILLPLLAALSLAIPGTSRIQARIIALGAAGLTLAMVVSLTVRLDRDAAGRIWVGLYGAEWADMNDTPPASTVLAAGSDITVSPVGG